MKCHFHSASNCQSKRGDTTNCLICFIFIPQKTNHHRWYVPLLNTKKDLVSKYCFSEVKKSTETQFHVTVTWYITMCCIKFVFDLGRVNRPSLARVVEKLCLSAVKDSCLYKTFGLCDRNVSNKGNQRASQPIFHLEPARTTAHCVYNSSMSVTKGEMGLFVLCLLFHKGHCCTRPNRCKCLSISLDQCNLHFKVRLIHLITKNKGCTIPSQLQLTGKIYQGGSLL